MFCFRVLQEEVCVNRSGHEEDSCVTRQEIEEDSCVTRPEIEEIHVWLCS
jgi:hypothetical protein